MTIGEIIERATDLSGTASDPSSAALKRADEAFMRDNFHAAQLWVLAAVVLARGRH